MTFFVIATALTLVVLWFILRIRPSDLPEPAAVSPYHHLETRKAAIYENLRDLQFEYRLGKLSDDDYKRTKLELQGELAKVLAEIDRVQKSEPVLVGKAPKQSAAAATPSKTEGSRVCPHCGAKFDRVLKFCGECGKAMIAQETA